MKHKYEKPMQRDIRDLALASGSCLSGINPTEQCTPTGNVNSAYCNAGGAYAYKECTPGGGANVCSTGTYAAYAGG
jgi:hypothetical protein